MELNRQTSELVALIEYTIGSHCYNPNSYDGYRDEYGCGFRYPVNYQASKGGIEKKTRSKVPDHFTEIITPDMVKSMRYKFGSNQLNIGNAIIEVLEMLEERYSINFNQLEEEYNAEQLANQMGNQ